LFAALRKEQLYLMIGLLAVSSALHAEERRPTRGERLALEGRCEVAVPELQKELEQVPAPESARVAWRLGQCELRARDYQGAAATLERALAIDPGLTEANLDLARARYHAGDLAGADAALRAGESLSGEALWQLYRGMVDLGRGDANAAVESLQRAVDINKSTFQTRDDPQAVEPAASYYLGVALRAAGREDQAKQRLEEVADAWAGTSWAAQANRAIGRGGAQRAFLMLSAGMEYDDNVVLLGHEEPLPGDISDESDFRGVWRLFGRTDLWRWGDTSTGMWAGYEGRAHIDDDLRDFDSHQPIASLWLDHALRGDTHLRARYDFRHIWFGGDPFLLSNGGRLSLIHAWSTSSSTELFGTLFGYDYQDPSPDVPDGPGTPGATCGSPASVCGPPGLNERKERDRDGWGGSAGVSHAWVLPIPGLPAGSPSLSGGYEFTRFSAAGLEYGHQAHRFSAQLSIPLPLGIALDVEGSYTNRIFDHPTTFPDRAALLAAASPPPPRQYFLSNLRRREHTFTTDVYLTVPVAGPFSVSAYYRYLDRHSNADVFDYDRNIAGLVFNYTLSRTQ
jgi:tetratricopeptide (TPR) repeat protein